MIKYYLIVIKKGGAYMDKTQYLELINRKYEKYFQVKNNENIMNKNFDIYAKYTETTGRTFVTQKDIIDKFEVNEHCFIKTFRYVDLSMVNELGEYFKLLTENFVKPHKEHKSTTITGVIVSENVIDKDIQKYIKSFRCSKYYKFYFQGWSDVRLIAVDLAKGIVITNKKGKEVEKIYRPIY